MTSLKDKYLDIFPSYENAIIDLEKFSKEISEEIVKELSVISKKVYILKEENSDVGLDPLLNELEYNSLVEVLTEDELKNKTGSEKLFELYDKFYGQIEGIDFDQDEDSFKEELAWFLAAGVHLDSIFVYDDEYKDDIESVVISEGEKYGEDKRYSSISKFSEAERFEEFGVSDILRLRKNREDLLEEMNKIQDASEIFNRREKVYRFNRRFKLLSEGIVVASFGLFGKLVAPYLNINNILMVFLGILVGYMVKKRLMNQIFGFFRELNHLTRDRLTKVYPKTQN